MTKILLTILILCFLAIIEFRRYQHLWAATIIYPVMWILSLLGLVYARDEYYEIGWTLPCIILLGYLLFILGFRILSFGIQNKSIYQTKKEDNATNEYDIGSKMVGLNLIVIMGVCITIVTVYYMLDFLDFHNLLGSLMKIKSIIDSHEKPFPYYVMVGRYFFRCAIWYLSLQYFKIPKGKKCITNEGKNYRIVILWRLIAIVFMSFIVMFTDVSRNDILMTVLPVLFIYLICRKISNRRIVILVGIGFVMFLVLFVVFMYFRKGSFKLFKQEGFSVAEERIVYYLSGSIPALDQLYERGEIKFFTLEGENGRYTFSLLAAISDMLLGTDLKPEVVQEEIRVGGKKVTNVFTYYQWLGKDFGLLYAVIFQFIYGMLYGVLYNKIKKNEQISIFMYSVMSYPLCMMFFEDQYLSIAQTWLIIFVFSLLIFGVCNDAKIKARLY